MTKVLDKQMLREALLELILEDRALFKDLLKEAIQEFHNNDEEINQLIKKNFSRFEDTFKALA